MIHAKSISGLDEVLTSGSKMCWHIVGGYIYAAEYHRITWFYDVCEQRMIHIVYA